MHQMHYDVNVTANNTALINKYWVKNINVLEENTKNNNIWFDCMFFQCSFFIPWFLCTLELKKERTKNTGFDFVLSIK